MTTTTATTTYDEFIDTAAEAGMLPADAFDFGKSDAWFSQFDAVTAVATLDSRRTGNLFACASCNEDDADVRLYILDRFGVTYSEARFDLTALGLAMFGGAVTAAVQA